jgi:hypothetical protein
MEKGSLNGRRLVPVCAIALLVSLAAGSGFVFDSGLDSDANGFAAAGRMMLSGAWPHTYHDPWLQAGPFEALACLVAQLVGSAHGTEPAAFDALGALALAAVSLRVLRDWRGVLFVGLGALLLGIVTDVYAIGHPSELLISLTWLVAARSARRDQALLAGLLVGASAGFETWGLLGAPVLLLLPRFRQMVAAGAVALAVAAAIYAPFALAGDFHMFELHWTIVGGIEGRLWGEGAAFTWPMRLGEAAIVVGLGAAAAVALRGRTSAAVWIVPTITSFSRLLLDPVRYGYYWDTGLTLLLIGCAPWAVAPTTAVERLRDAIARRAVVAAPHRFVIPSGGSPRA